MDENSLEALIGSTQCLLSCGCGLLNLLIIIAAVSVAKRKNRSAVLWGLLAFFFSFPALLILLLLPSVQAAAAYSPPQVGPYPPYSPPAPPPPASPPYPVPAPPPGAFDATMIQPAGSWRLTVVQGPESGQSYGLASHTRLGRAPDNDIRLSDPQSSRYHALIQRRQESYLVSDQGSGNGTLVNGRQITGPTKLSPGDIIAIGNTQIRVEEAK